MSVDSSRIPLRVRSPALSQLSRRFSRHTLAGLRAVAFWIAVGAPWLVLGLAVSGRLDSHPELFAGLLFTTVCCGLIGRNYRRTR